MTFVLTWHLSMCIMSFFLLLLYFFDLNTDQYAQLIEYQLVE